MNNFLKILVFTFFSILVSGCSDNIKRYKADPSLKHQLQPYNFKNIELQSVTMPKGDDNNVMCRLNSMISLPDKMKYSQYIQDAVKKSLVFINDKPASSASSHILDILLTKVEVNTFTARWYIDANVTVDNHEPVLLQTVTNHNFSYVAPSACNNAANAFDEAVDNFIKKLFTHPKIAEQHK